GRCRARARHRRGARGRSRSGALPGSDRPAARAAHRTRSGRRYRGDLGFPLKESLAPAARRGALASRAELEDSMQRILAPRSIAALAALGLGCAALGIGKKEPVAARIGDQTLTVAELDAQIKDDLWRHQTGDNDPLRVHELRLAALKSIIPQRVLDAEAK